MFCESLLKYKEVHLETAIVEARHMRLDALQGVFLVHRGIHSKFQRKSVEHPPYLHQMNTLEASKIMSLPHSETSVSKSSEYDT